MSTARGFAETFVSDTIGIDLRRAAQPPSRVASLCNDLFLIAVRMREVGDLGDPASLRKLILHYLSQLADNCRIAGVRSTTAEDVRFALVALLDETVLSVPGACRDYWLSQPLQLELFGEALAGEQFYRRVERMLAPGAGDTGALEVYCFCLCLGFEGKYKLGGGEARRELVTQLAAKLTGRGAMREESLSVHAVRADEGDGAGRRWRRALWYAPAVAALALLAAAWVSVVAVGTMQDARSAAAIGTLSRSVGE